MGRKDTAAVDTTIPHTKQIINAAIKVPPTLSLLKAIMLHLPLRCGADGDEYSLELRSNRSGAHTSFRTRWRASCPMGTLGSQHESPPPLIRLSSHTHINLYLSWLLNLVMWHITLSHTP